jgi:hypothetical protein
MADRSAISRAVRQIFRALWRATVIVKRTTEAIAISFGGTPGKVDRFNRLIAPEVALAADAISVAEVLVGIPFHREVVNLPAVVRKAQVDLEYRGERAAILIVGEYKTRGLLFSIPLPASTDSVKIVRITKPPHFGQKPGLSRRSWTHWAIFQVAKRLRSDIVFIDADVRNTQGWVDLYLRAIRENRADIAVANYIRSFGSDDALVHIWDRLIFGALFGRWIEFRQGGDYAISRHIVPEILKNPLMMREGVYTLDSAVMAYVAAHSGLIEFVWLGRKEHEPIEPQKLFKRLTALVQSVFDDIESHLSAILAIKNRKRLSLTASLARPENPAMQELIGNQFRHDLYADLLHRFQASSDLIQLVLGRSLFRHFVEITKGSGAFSVSLTPQKWARASFRFLSQYLWTTKDGGQRTALAKAYVPVLEAGALAFLNLTAEMRYQDAMRLLEDTYLPAFQGLWLRLARRTIFRQASRWPRWSTLLRSGRGERARLQSALPGKPRRFAA